jgi:hypothetical protein
MMVEYTPEIQKLDKEVDPWLAYDSKTESFYVKPEAPQEIRNKYKHLMKLLDNLYAPFENW